MSLGRGGWSTLAGRMWVCGLVLVAVGCSDRLMRGPFDAGVEDAGRAEDSAVEGDAKPDAALGADVGLDVGVDAGAGPTADSSVETEPVDAGSYACPPAATFACGELRCLLSQVCLRYGIAGDICWDVRERYQCYPDCEVQVRRFEIGPIACLESTSPVVSGSPETGCFRSCE